MFCTSLLSMGGLLGQQSDEFQLAITCKYTIVTHSIFSMIINLINDCWDRCIHSTGRTPP